MKLKEIVETTFLPPTVAKISGYGDDFGYQVNFNNNNGKFFPCFQNSRNGNSYNINESGKKAFSYSRDRTFFNSRKNAIKHCWKYFYSNQDFFKPNLEIKNET